MSTYTKLQQLQSQVDWLTRRLKGLINAGSNSSYKKYVALLSQTGIDDPVALVLENTLGSDVVWTRSGQGSYTGTCVGAFTENKTFIVLGNTNANLWYAYTSDADTVTVETQDAVGAADEKLILTPCEIRVYL